MTNPKHNGPGHDSAEIEAVSAHERPETAAVLPDDRKDEAVTVAATVGIVAVGVALFEVALLPGMAIGVAAMLAPKYVPKMGEALTPMFKSTVRGVYKFGQKTREMVAARKIEEEANFLAEHSDAAKAVVDFCKHWAREIKVASGNLVDLKMVLCIGLVGYTIFEVGAAAATPVWVTLTLFGLNHFIEMQSELAEREHVPKGAAVPG